MTIGKTIALTRWTFVGKVMSLLFHMLSRLVIAFLPIIIHRILLVKSGKKKSPVFVRSKAFLPILSITPLNLQGKEFEKDKFTGAPK